MFKTLISLIFGSFLVFGLIGCGSLDEAASLNQKGKKKEALEMAAKYLDSDKKSERIRAINIIGEIGGERAGELILPKMDDSEEEVRIVAIKNLGELRYEPAGKKMIDKTPKVFGDEFDEIAKALGKLGPPSTDLLVKYFQDPSMQGNRDAYRSMLIAIGATITDSIVKSLKGKSYFENRDNYSVLIAIKSPMVADMLVPYLEDDEVAHLAAEGLVQLGSLAVNPVMNALQKEIKSDNSKLKERLITVLGDLRNPRATDLLLQFDQDDNELVRDATREALRKVRGF